MDLLRAMVAVSVTLVLWPDPGSADEVAQPAVRSRTAVLRQAFLAGCLGSQTFRSLGDGVAAANGVVDVEFGACRGQRGCLLHWMATAGPRRFLRVLISPKLRPDEYASVIAHELQHAQEVLRDPTVRSAAAIYFLFRPPNREHRTAFETDAAVETGLRVREELKHTPDDGEIKNCAATFAVAGTDN